MLNSLDRSLEVIDQKLGTSKPEFIPTSDVSPTAPTPTVTALPEDSAGFDAEGDVQYQKLLESTLADDGEDDGDVFEIDLPKSKVTKTNNVFSRLTRLLFKSSPDDAAEEEKLLREAEADQGDELTTAKEVLSLQNQHREDYLKSLSENEADRLAVRKEINPLRDKFKAGTISGKEKVRLGKLLGNLDNLNKENKLLNGLLTGEEENIRFISNQIKLLTSDDKQTEFDTIVDALRRDKSLSLSQVRVLGERADSLIASADGDLKGTNTFRAALANRLEMISPVTSEEISSVFSDADASLAMKTMLLNELISTNDPSLILERFKDVSDALKLNKTDDLPDFFEKFDKTISGKVSDAFKSAEQDVELQEDTLQEVLQLNKEIADAKVDGASADELARLETNLRKKQGLLGVNDGDALSSLKDVKLDLLNAAKVQSYDNLDFTDKRVLLNKVIEVGDLNSEELGSIQDELQSVYEARLKAIQSSDTGSDLSMLKIAYKSSVEVLNTHLEGAELSPGFQEVGSQIDRAIEANTPDASAPESTATGETPTEKDHMSLKKVYTKHLPSMLVMPFLKGHLVLMLVLNKAITTQKAKVRLQQRQRPQRLLLLDHQVAALLRHQTKKQPSSLVTILITGVLTRKIVFLSGP